MTPTQITNVRKDNNMKRIIAHWLVGHIPYYVFTENEEMRYRCTLCGKYLRKSGFYNTLEVVGCEDE